MRVILSLVILFLFAFSCSKKGDQPTPTTPTPPPADIEVDNTWKCEVGGKLYQGTIDTSFYTIFSELERRDTNIYIIGSTADGRANITMKMMINRTAKDWVRMGLGGGFMTFDTASTNVMTTLEGTIQVPFRTEAFTGKKLKGTFSGELRSYNDRNEPVTNAVSNGTISVELGKGTGAPKFMTVAVANSEVTGPIRSAVHRTNTLIIDGVSFSGGNAYQLQVRTGAAIKPGTYKSSDGDVGFYLWRPSITTHNVSDVQGDLSVTIQSVDGNIVTGTFSGQSLAVSTGGAAVNTTGQFKCRVKDYAPGVDAKNQWQFNIEGPFTAVGGNINDAAITQSAGRHLLTLRGTSDNGSSVFYLKLASFGAFAPGIYPVESFTDSCYLSRPDVKYFNSNDKFYVRIDTLTSTRLVGAFYGDFTRSGLLYGGGIAQTVRKGYFRTDGQF